MFKPVVPPKPDVFILDREKADKDKNTVATDNQQKSKPLPPPPPKKSSKKHFM